MMGSYYDLYGWYTATPIPGRAAPVAPENTAEPVEPGALRANWTGRAWVDRPYLPPPPAPDPLAEIRERLWEEIKGIRDRRMQTSGYEAAGAWFHSDTSSRIQQLGLARKADRIEAAAGDMGVPFPGPGPGGVLVWKTMSGTFVPMTPALAQAIFGAAEALDLALFAHAEMLRAQVDLAPDPGAIDIETGWPPGFQES